MGVYLGRVESAISTWRLESFKSVFTYGVSPNLDQLSARVEEYIPADIKGFLSSKQNNGPLTAFAWLNPVQLSLVLLSLVLIPGLIHSKFSPLPNQKLLWAGILLGLGILIHAWVCGTFANPIDRLGNKMIWILPFLAMILLLKADSKFKDSCLKSH